MSRQPGPLRAVIAADDPPPLALDAGDEVLLRQRDYRFTSPERDRGQALMRLARRALTTVAAPAAD